ncbi:MAG TPA: HPF/RaiA family ribosome-associated protein [Nitrospira sp.]|nr:HPF/RaiA family ribosome-associated protein [Nitrospira sp.]
MKLKIECRNVTMAPRWKKEIENRMAGLQRGHDDVIHGRVTLITHRRHKQNANAAEALIVLSVRGRHTFTARAQNATLDVAIRDAFETVRIELDKHREKRHERASGRNDIMVDHADV